MPGPYDSELLPYRSFIFQCREKKMSYAKIAKALMEEHGVKTSYQNVHRFVKDQGDPKIRFNETFARQLTAHIMKFLRNYKK